MLLMFSSWRLGGRISVVNVLLGEARREG